MLWEAHGIGTFKRPLRISSMDGKQAREIEATANTGVSFNTLAVNLFRELSIEVAGKRSLLRTDELRLDMDNSQARASID